MYSSADKNKKSDSPEVVLNPTHSILTGATSSNYAGILMKQTLVSNNMSQYRGANDPMFKTGYMNLESSIVGAPHQDFIKGWEP
jgi:hypothetical protein